MTAFITLTLSNREVQQIFTRPLKNGNNFYLKIIEKINRLVACCHEQRVYAYLKLYQMNEAVTNLTQQFFDDIDNYDSLLEKKQYLVGKNIRYEAQYFPEIPICNAVTGTLVELFTVYDRLISRLKTLRLAGCFMEDNDYFSNLRRHFKDINRLLSTILVSSVSALPTLSLDDVIYEKEEYLNYVKAHDPIDTTHLLTVLSSPVIPRLVEKVRQPYLLLLRQKIAKQGL